MRRFSDLVLTVLVLLLVATSPLPAATSWPGLRGPDSDGAVRDADLLSQGAGGLALGWKKALGSGYSAVVVAEGRAVTMFADGEDDILAAFDVESGKEELPVIVKAFQLNPECPKRHRQKEKEGDKGISTRSALFQ